MKVGRFDIVPLEEWGLFDNDRPCIIAGPCSAESYAQLRDTAAQLRECGIGVIRAGLWKPRSRPGNFEGIGEEGLEWLSGIRAELGVKVCTEVASARHVESCLRHDMDMLWIGARTTANPFLVQEIADALEGSGVPVLVKNPVNPDLGLWLGALERLSLRGVRKMGVIHRGFSTAREGIYRNDPQWNLAISLRTVHPELPFFCDPSHISGRKEYIREISEKAMELDLDGLMIESHCNPEKALSDASQQLTPRETAELISVLVKKMKGEHGDVSMEQISTLRERIDEIDDRLLRCLSERMAVSTEIGRIKKENNMPVLQSRRWEEVLSRIEGDAVSCGLDPRFVRKVYSAIHEESVRLQDVYPSDKK